MRVKIKLVETSTSVKKEKKTLQERFETFTVLINRISRNIKKIKNSALAEYNLRSAHISCVYYLYLDKGITATALCEKCEEDKATVSRALEYLEKNGYITRKEPAAKRYNSPLMPTEKGAEIGAKIAEKIKNVLEKTSEEMPEEKRKEFYGSLAIISQKLDLIANCRNE